MTASPDSSTRLGLPWLMPAQAQKHVTHNEALRRLDALVQAAVESRSVAEEPSAPAEGQGWIVAEGASGAHWSGFEAGDLVVFQDGAWARFQPAPGWRVWVIDAGELAIFDATAWQGFTPGEGEAAEFVQLGVGTAPDDANPFSAKLNAALWAARSTGEGGTGDLRYTLNKEAPGNVLSLLFQSGWEGRAEIGLVGDDDFLFKVSADGANWNDALRIDRATGRMDASAGLAVAGVPASTMMLTPGGDGEVSIWRIDTPHGANPRTATLASVSGNLLNLSEAIASEFFHSHMEGVSLVRIWNLTRSPIAPAWIEARPGSAQLRVTDMADITGWQPGDTLQLGDPASVTPGNVIAMDISPMMQAVLGRVFAQSAIMVRPILTGATQGDQITMTPSGVSGSHITCARTYIAGLPAGDGVTIVPCTVPSPVSDSNLVLLREWIGSTASLSILSCLAVFA